MRCFACNKLLSDRESTRRFVESQSFVDLCDPSLNSLAEDLDVTDGYQDGDEHEEDIGFDRYE